MIRWEEVGVRISQRPGSGELVAKELRFGSGG